MTLPQRLERSPLVDALFELRFEPATPAAADLLPGLLYSAFDGEYTDVQPLPMASVPREIRDQDPTLRYQPYHRLVSGDRQIQVGQRVITLSHGIAYPGWEQFKSHVQRLLVALRSTRLVRGVERFSFRYINLIPALPDAQLSSLNVRFEILGEPVPEQGFQLRVESLSSNFLTILQIQTNVSIALPAGETRVGVLVDVDTIRSVNSEAFWNSQEDLLTEAHDALKHRFFSMLTESTLSDLGPVFE